MIYDIESTDIKASVAVSRVIWALLNAIFSGDEEDDLLSFQDKELLEDILRFGTMAEVGRRSGRTYYAISTQLASVLDRLDAKVNSIDGEMGKLARLRDEIIAMQAKIASYVNELNEKNIELLETKSELHQLKGSLTHTQHKLSQAEAEHTHTKTAFVQVCETLDQYKAEIAQLKTALAKLEADLAKSKADLAKSNVIHKEGQRKIAQLEKDLAKSKQKEAGYKTLYENGQQKIAELISDTTVLKKEIALNDKPKKKLNKYEQERVEKLKSRIESLENLVEWYKNQKTTI